MVDKYKYAGPNDYIDDYRTHATRGAFDGRLGGPQVAFKKLKQAVDVLPSPVNCSDVDGGLLSILEHQLKEAADTAKSELEGLHALADILKRERMRCEENLEILDRDRRHIQNQNPQEYYSEATERQAEQYNAVLEQQRIVLELISAMESLLREAVQRIRDANGAPSDSDPVEEDGQRDDTVPKERGASGETVPVEDEPYGKPEL